MIEIRASGPNAAAVADAAEAFLRDLSGETPARQAVTADGETTRGDPIAIATLVLAGATLVLAVPQAIAATLDLVGRRKQAERLDRLLAALEAKAGADDHVELKAGDGPPLDLLATDRDRLMDALSEAVGKAG